MIEINGKYTDAKIYTNQPQQTAIEQIGETVTIQKHITPVYNFKASDKWTR